MTTDRFELAALLDGAKMDRKLIPDPKKPEQAAICSFCHKSEHEVEFMLLASVSAICSECIKLHFRIFCEHQKEHGGQDADKGDGSRAEREARKGA